MPNEAHAKRLIADAVFAAGQIERKISREEARTVASIIFDALHRTNSVVIDEPSKPDLSVSVLNSFRNPFVSGAWHYDLNDASLWTWQAPRGALLAPLLTAGGQPPTETWRYDYDDSCHLRAPPEPSLNRTNSVVIDEPSKPDLEHKLLSQREARISSMALDANLKAMTAERREPRVTQRALSTADTFADLARALLDEQPTPGDGKSVFSGVAVRLLLVIILIGVGIGAYAYSTGRIQLTFLTRFL